jgi:hypothetical protein
MPDRPQKITFADMCEMSMGASGLLIYCSDYRCSHSQAISGDQWPEDVRLSDLESRGLLGLRQARRRRTGFGRASGVDPQSW